MIWVPSQLSSQFLRKPYFHVFFEYHDCILIVIVYVPVFEHVYTNIIS